MKKCTPQTIDREWLRRCKARTPERALLWLEEAVKFAREAERARKRVRKATR